VRGGGVQARAQTKGRISRVQDIRRVSQHRGEWAVSNLSLPGDLQLYNLGNTLCALMDIVHAEFWVKSACPIGASIMGYRQGLRLCQPVSNHQQK